MAPTRIFFCLLIKCCQLGSLCGLNICWYWLRSLSMMSGSACGRRAGRTPVSLKRVQSAYSAWAPWAINQHCGWICQNLRPPNGRDSNWHLPSGWSPTQYPCQTPVLGTAKAFGFWLKHLWHRKEISLEHLSDTSSGLTCVVAQTLPLLPPPVQPDAEAHEDDPAGSADAGNKSRLFHHIGDLLRDAVVPVSVYYHVPELFTCREQGGTGDVNASVNRTLPEAKAIQLLLQGER